MPGRPDLAVRVDGLADLRRSLRAIDRELPKELRVVIKGAAEVIAAEARVRAPKRTGKLAGSIKATTSGASGIVRSRLPYANVQNWGGTIRPRGAPTHIKGRHFVDGALDAKREAAAQALARGMDDLLRRQGWT